MTKLDDLFSGLDKKIKDLKIVFDAYQKITMSTSQAEGMDDFEYLKADIKLIKAENASILEALNLYIQKRVEVIGTMSIIVKYCLSHADFLDKSQEIITYLEKTYNEKSGYQLMYCDCYLNSSLAALNIASKYDFITLLENIKNVTDANLETPGMEVANLQMKNALTFMVLSGSSINADKMINLLKENEFDNTSIILNAIEDARKMNFIAADNFINQNKEWLQVDLKSNLATFEADDWTIVDHVVSPVKKKVEIAKDFFHDNLIAEYSDILKIFKDVQTSKTLLDLSHITDDFKSLVNSAVNNSLDISIKEKLNLSNIPLVIDIGDITINDTKEDISKLMGNSEAETE